VPRLQTIKKRTTSAAWLLVVLLVFAPLGPHAAAAVLCFGADGHIAAELAGGSACTDAPTDAPALPVDAAEGASTDGVPQDVSHCGTCTDIPLPSGGDEDCASFTTERAPTAQAFLPLVQVLPARHHLPSPPPFTSSALDGHATPPADPVLLSSVVLLI
jgi:hypothetical protein